MSAGKQMPDGSGIALSIYIGQRVRHADYQGRRVTGVVSALSVEDRALLVDIVLDTPIVIPASGDVPAINIYRQHVPAHELTPFDERDELIAEMLASLKDMQELVSLLAANCFDRVDVSNDPRLGAARTAIAKATGSAT